MKYVSTTSGETIHKKDYSKRIIFSPDDFDQPGHLLQTVTIPPKTKQRLHWHTKQTEVFFILEGECVIYINDDEFLAKPGDAFITSPGDKHNLWNKTRHDFKLAVFKIDLPSTDDTEWVE